MLIEGSFEARVKNFPKLYYRIEGILAIAENEWDLYWKRAT